MLIQLAVDIGGSFTDVVLLRGGKLYTTKTMTTTVKPEIGVMRGVEEVLKLGNTDFSEVERFIFGTTLATNALIERKGPVTALITTEGFTDIIEMARENRYAQYDLYMQRAKPLVPRPLRFGIKERLNPWGEVVVPLDKKSVQAVIDQLQKYQVRSVAICLMHSYANGTHEREVAALIHHVDPSIKVSISSEICPEIREYERTSTVCANAYVQPIIASALEDMKDILSKAGMRCPIFLMTSSGALCSLELGKDQPVRLVESGPAGGAIFAAHVAKQCGLEKAIAFDMGGTTAKVSYLNDYEPVESRIFEFDRTYRFLKGSGQPIRMPVIEMVEIGAGGGSIAHLDEMKRLRVGPESAVSEPGPVCFAMGGRAPTVTDANAVMGYLDPNRFADGKIKLDIEAAKSVFANDLQQQLALSSPEETAAMVSEVVTENMASAARVHGIELGHDIGEFTAVAMGGGGPLHIGRIAKKLGISKVVIPTEASVGSALGFLVAPVQFGVVRTALTRISALKYDELSKSLAQMKDEACHQVQEMVGDAHASISVKFGAYMRYRGQGYEIKITFTDLPEHLFQKTLQERFELMYEKLYHRRLTGIDVEVVTWFVNASHDMESFEIQPVKESGVANEAHQRSVVMAEADMQESVVNDYERASLQPGFQFMGPAVVSERHTSTIVPTGYHVRVDEQRYLIIEEVDNGNS